MQRSRRRLLTLVAIAIPLWLARASADETVANPEVQAAVLAKVLGYDMSLDKRKGPIAIAVVARKDHAGSKALQAAIHDHLAALSRKVKVRGRALAPTKIWSGELKDRNVEVVYLSAALEDELAAIAAHARGHGILTTTGLHSYVTRGVMLAVLPKPNGGHEIVINLKEAEAAHANFDTRLLLVARVIRP
jgi:hypothetical protein